MTANVTIEIARRSNVTRVPTMALRFRPTTDMFAALGQEPPPETRGRAADGATASGATGTQGQPPAGGATGDGSRAPETRSDRQRQLDAGGPAERRRRFQERMQNMSPEERAQFAQRMRERGFEPGPGGNGNGGTSAKPAAPSSPLNGNAQTIDQLFGPLPQAESTAVSGRFRTSSSSRSA